MRTEEGRNPGREELLEEGRKEISISNGLFMDLSHALATGSAMERVGTHGEAMLHRSLQGTRFWRGSRAVCAARGAFSDVMV